MTDRSAIIDAVDCFGSHRKLAKAIARSQQHVSRLVSGQYEIGAEDAVRIENATHGQVPRWRLRPDLWSAPTITHTKAARPQAPQKSEVVA